MNCKDLVKLNVGGKVFHTTRSSLAGSSFFTNLLSGDFMEGSASRESTDISSVDDIKMTCELDENSESQVKEEEDQIAVSFHPCCDSEVIFIDRSPKLFSILLEYLRTGILNLPPSVSKARICDEAIYYGITGEEHPVFDVSLERQRTIETTYLFKETFRQSIGTDRPLILNASAATKTINLLSINVWSTAINKSMKFPSLLIYLESQPIVSSNGIFNEISYYAVNDWGNRTMLLDTSVLNFTKSNNYSFSNLTLDSGAIYQISLRHNHLCAYCSRCVKCGNPHNSNPSLNNCQKCEPILFPFVQIEYSVQLLIPKRCEIHPE